MNSTTRNWWWLFVPMVILFAVGCGTTRLRARSEAVETTRVWPQPPDQPRIQFIQVLTSPTDANMQGSALERFLGLFAGRKEDYLELPQQVSVGPGGRLYVTDHLKKCVHIFDFSKKRYMLVDTFGKQPLYSPGGVAEGENGWFYVSDAISRRILVFDAAGKPLFDFGGPGIFRRPTGLVFLPQTRNLYVVDTLAHRVIVFDREGNLQFQFGHRGEGNGTFNYPTYIAHDNHGHIYVTDTLNHRIQVFDREGNFLAAFGKPGNAYGSFSKPKGVAVDSRGNIYVVDSLHDVVQIFNQEGQLLLPFCDPGSDVGQLWLPSGVAIDADDKIYVADTFNKRVQIFQLLPEETSH